MNKLVDQFNSLKEGIEPLNSKKLTEGFGAGRKPSTRKIKIVIDEAPLEWVRRFNEVTGDMTKKEKGEWLVKIIGEHFI